jgi:hypothetical protein
MALHPCVIGATAASLQPPSAKLQPIPRADADVVNCDTDHRHVGGRGPGSRAGATSGQARIERTRSGA